MKVLICTPVFPPSIGGLETINVLLANELVKNGWDVTVVTPALIYEKDDYRFKVVRRPGVKELMHLYMWCDVFVHNALVLKYTFPTLLFRKPFVIIHHSCTYNWNQSRNIQSLTKYLISLFARNISVSHAVADSLKLPKSYTVIHNYYDSSVFTNTNSEMRSGFVYVGRLSREKGVDLLIRAYEKYLSLGGTMTLTIVGDGGERQKLESMIKSISLNNMVQFTGFLDAAHIKKLLNNRKAIILPSICKEAFGIVLLEAMACGCFCIGSDGDGIQEAMGGNGFLFKKGNVESLTQALLKADNIDEYVYQDYIDNTKKFLKEFEKERITKKYIDYFQQYYHKFHKFI